MFPKSLMVFRAIRPASGLPTLDLARTRCGLLRGQNPSTSWLTHATALAAARGRGAKLIVVDPRRVPL
jgi:anaerobic selenocysteine-containing dehydrogenase